MRLWRMEYGDLNDPLETSVKYLCTLRKHTQAVNAVRFDPHGNSLATASDDGLLLVWKLSPTVVVDFGHQDDDAEESWVVTQVHNTGSEIYDLSWSPDGRYVAVSCMNNTCKIFDVVANSKVCELAMHAHYVQGVAWDPKNEYFASLSADRALHVYAIDSSSGSLNLTNVMKIGKTDQYLQLMSALVANVREAPEKRPAHLYHSETLQSFFRRLAFSPDGSLLLTPLGVFKKEEFPTGGSSDLVPESTVLNTVYIYTRNGLERPPICHLPGLPKPAVAVCFNPLMYKLSGAGQPVFSLPYKMVFAVATQNSVYIYDTELLQPLGMATNLHYLTITDLCWENDGQSLMVASADGFCSVIVFERGVFGETTQVCHREAIENGRSAEEEKEPKKSGLDGFFVKSSSPKTLEIKKEEATISAAPKVPQSLLDQFIAPPVANANDSVAKEEPTEEQKEEHRKKRVVPTLIQDYK